MSEEAEDQCRHTERVGPSLPRHLYQLEEDLPEAGRILLAVRSDGATKGAMEEPSRSPRKLPIVTVAPEGKLEYRLPLPCPKSPGLYHIEVKSGNRYVGWAASP